MRSDREIGRKPIESLFVKLHWAASQICIISMGNNLKVDMRDIYYWAHAIKIIYHRIVVYCRSNSNRLPVSGNLLLSLSLMTRSEGSNRRQIEWTPLEDLVEGPQRNLWIICIRPISPHWFPFYPQFQKQLTKLISEYHDPVAEELEWYCKILDRNKGQILLFSCMHML